MYESIIDFLRKSGRRISEVVERSVEELADIVGAEGEADVEHVMRWLEEKRMNYQVNVQEVPISSLEKWVVDPDSGNISHESGKFFSIVGMKVEGAKGREVVSWSQPIMKQKECGILGVIRQRKAGVMRYLLYAKSEPGSIINPQLSPSLQATSSNLLRVHGGHKPRLAEYFEEGGRGKVIVSVEQVEDPSRFYLKTNRCMIVEVPEQEEVPITDDYIWLTLPQIKILLTKDRVINALLRAVLACI